MIKPDWKSLKPTGKVEAIKSVYRPGMSAADIGRALGVTRNSIIGVYTRHDEALSAHPLQSRNGGDKGFRAKVARSKKLKPAVKPQAAKKPERIIIPIQEPVSYHGVRLFDLGRNQCRWAVTPDDCEPDEHLFCGNKTEVGTSYCPGHFQTAYGGGTQSEKCAVRTMMSICKREGAA